MKALRGVGMLAVGGVLLPGQLLAPVPALASTGSISGGGVWGGVLTLSPYPCVGGCLLTPADFTGWFAGSVTAKVGSTIYTATWPTGLGNNLVPNNVTYNESCGTAPALPPDSGNASGQWSVIGGLLTVNGASAGGAVLVAWVDWGRTDEAATITVSAVELENGAGAVLVSTSGVGVGAAVFGAPVPTTPGNLPPSCSNEESVAVAVAGTYTQPD